MVSKLGITACGGFPHRTHRFVKRERRLAPSAMMADVGVLVDVLETP